MLGDKGYEYRYNVEMDGIVGEQGIHQIKNELDYWYGIQLPSNFDWSPTTKAGRVNRRLSKLVHDTVGFDLPREVTEWIGNTYDRYYVPPSNRYFDFTRNFNWERGDFGDGNSCFFGGSQQRHIIHSNGGYAVRFWNEAQGKNGYGRAWMLDIKEGSLIWNCYGNGLTLVRIGEILAKWSGWKAFPGIPYQWASGSESVYLNSGGFLLMAQEKPTKPVEINWNRLPARYELPNHT